MDPNLNALWATLNVLCATPTIAIPCILICTAITASIGLSSRLSSLIGFIGRLNYFVLSPITALTLMQAVYRKPLEGTQPAVSVLIVAILALFFAYYLHVAIVNKMTQPSQDAQPPAPEHPTTTAPAPLPQRPTQAPHTKNG